MPTETGNLQLRRGISSLWASSNPVLLDGEPGYDKTAKTLRVGDGSRQWSALDLTTLMKLDNAGATGNWLQKSADGAQWSPLTIASLLNVIVEQPEQHGAARDGRILNDAVMPTVGSGVFQSASNPFTPAIVNKSIMVNGAGSVGLGNILYSTVASYQGPGQVTLSNPAVHAVNGQLAAYGTDDTAAIKNAIAAAVAACQANKTYYCQVLFSQGIYFCPGALDNSQLGHSQIPIPLVAPGIPKVTLVLQGVYDASALLHWSQTFPQASGSAILSCLPAPAYSPTLGTPSIIGGPTNEQSYGGNNNANFSNLLVSIDGLNIMGPIDGTTHGVDMYGVAECNVGSLAVTSLATVTAPGIGNTAGMLILPAAGTVYSGNYGVAGLVMPSFGNNDNCNIDLYSCEGWFTGLWFSEHTAARSVRIINAAVGIASVGPDAGYDHSAWFGYLSTEACRIHIMSGGAGGPYPVLLTVSDWDPEDGQGSAIQTVWHVYDNAGSPGLLRGRIALNSRVISGNLAVSGGGLEIIDVSQTPGTPLGGQPAVPASTVAYQNKLGRNASVEIHCPAGVTVSAIVIDGTTMATTIAAGGTVFVTVPHLKNITLTYAGGTPTWRWILL